MPSRWRKPLERTPRQPRRAAGAHVSSEAADQTVWDQAVVGQAVVGQTVVGQTVLGQAGNRIGQVGEVMAATGARR